MRGKSEGFALIKMRLHMRRLLRQTKPKRAPHDRRITIMCGRVTRADRYHPDLYSFRLAATSQASSHAPLVRFVGTREVRVNGPGGGERLRPRRHVRIAIHPGACRNALSCLWRLKLPMAKTTRGWSRSRTSTTRRTSSDAPDRPTRGTPRQAAIFLGLLRRMAMICINAAARTSGYGPQTASVSRPSCARLFGTAGAPKQ